MRDLLHLLQWKASFSQALLQQSSGLRKGKTVYHPKLIWPQRKLVTFFNRLLCQVYCQYAMQISVPCVAYKSNTESVLKVFTVPANLSAVSSSWGWMVILVLTYCCLIMMMSWGTILVRNFPSTFLQQERMSPANINLGNLQLKYQVWFHSVVKASKSVVTISYSKSRWNICC